MAPAGGIRDPLGTCSTCSSGHASVAQLDVHLTGEEEVVGLTPTESATILEIWSWNIFYGHSVPSADSRKDQLSVSGEWMCTELVNRLED